MSYSSTDRGAVVNSRLLSKQLEKRVYAVPDAFLCVTGLSTPRNISPTSCLRRPLRSVCAMRPPRYQNAATGSQKPFQKNTAIHEHAVATRQTGSSLKMDHDLYAINHAGPGSSVAVGQSPDTNDLHPNGNDTDVNWKPSLRGQSDCGDAVCTISTHLPSRSKHNYREYVTGALAVALVVHSCRYIVCLRPLQYKGNDLSLAKARTQQGQKPCKAKA